MVCFAQGYAAPTFYSNGFSRFTDPYRPYSSFNYPDSRGRSYYRPVWVDDRWNDYRCSEPYPNYWASRHVYPCDPDADFVRLGFLGGLLACCLLS